MFKIIPVKITSTKRTVNTYALIDDGSAVTTIEPEIAQQLELKGESNPLVVEFADRTQKMIANSITISIDIKGILPRHKTFNIKARTMDMGLPYQTLTKSQLQFEGIDNPSITLYKDVQPQIIIGLDNITIAAPFKTQQYNNLLVSDSPLGWTVQGMTGGTGGDGKSEARIQTMSLIEIMHVVRNFIENENMGIDPKRPIIESEEMKSAKEQLAKGVKKVKVGYEAKLLWKDGTRPSISNRQYAIQRLKAAERQMDKDPKIREKANEIIQKYIDRNYITVVSSKDFNDGWYLPVFPVINPYKLRLVWDAAAKVYGMSLNDFLLKGPDLNEEIWNILMRFREFPIAFCADVTEMFHKIEMALEDRKFQMFLWRNDSTDEIITYQLNVQSFGAVCSPSIAQFVKNENALLHIQNFPEAVQAITKAFYVDDWLQSCRTEKHAEELIEQVTKIMKDANFELHKWITNSPNLLKIVGINEDKKLEKKDLQKTPKALGISWNNKEDSFSFDFEDILPDPIKVVTKRIMLSIVMRLFDPLGWLTFLIIVGRLLLREVWKVDCDWDEPVSNQILEK